MVLGLLKRLFGSQGLVSDLSKLGPGRATLEGKLAGTEDLVRSPLKGLSCVAYYYRAWYKAQARGKWVERVLKEAEVYAPHFFLDLEGGRIQVLPPKSSNFDLAEHRTLQGGGFQGFQVTEQVLRPGMKVRLQGVAVRREGGLVFRLKQIDLIPVEEEGTVYRRPPTRRRKRGR